MKWDGADTQTDYGPDYDPEEKRNLRRQIEEDTRLFLADGGAIEQLVPAWEQSIEELANRAEERRQKALSRSFTIGRRLS